MSFISGPNAIFIRRALLALTLLALLLSFAGAGAEATPIATDEPAYLEGDAETLRRAQERLIDLGLLNGRADGAYGPKTRAALTAFQSDNGLEETGRLDSETFERLTSVSPQTATARDVQQRLIDLDYLQGRADGIIGKQSVDALKLFQRLNGLPASGKPSDATLELLFSDEALALPASLSVGNEGDEVLKLQKRLLQFGFLDFEADGDYGQQTVAAVRSFQQHLIEQGYSDGIAADGVATPLTQYCLYSSEYSTYLREVLPDVTDSEALRLERRLVQLGYMDMAADDILDEYAVSALKLYQTRAMMQPDGLADRETFDAIFSADAVVADYCAPHDIASGDTGLAVRAVEEAMVYGGMSTRIPTGKYDGSLENSVERLYKYLQQKKDPNARLFADPKVLSKEAQKALQKGLLGANGFDEDSEADIARIQYRLYSLFYLPKEGIDGKFGRNSRNALRDFKADSGLGETGAIDEATLLRLFSAEAAAKPYPFRVEVSLDRQEVDVYQLNMLNMYDLVQTFTCSTGLHNSTPRGIFLDAHPVNRWHHFQKFNCWAQYSFVITGDIMFHSVLYSTNSESSLRNGSVWALGSPASHGCVRLSVKDAKWLFENCKRGKVVVVIS